MNLQNNIIQKFRYYLIYFRLCTVQFTLHEIDTLLLQLNQNVTPAFRKSNCHRFLHLLHFSETEEISC